MAAKKTSATSSRSGSASGRSITKRTSGASSGRASGASSGRSSGTSSGRSSGTSSGRSSAKSSGAGRSARSAGSKRSGSGSAARTARSSTAAKRSGGSRKQAEKEYIDYSLYYEIFLWVVIALSILLFISMLGFGGAFGKAVSSVLFGLFGIMGYVFPFLLFFLTSFMISNSSSRIARIKCIGVVFLFLTLCGMLQLIMIGYNKGYELAEYYQASAQYHIGGGWFGGALTSFFAPAIGHIGTYVVYLIMMIISLILITQRSLFDGVRRGGSSILRNAKEGRERRKEWLIEQREQRRSEREERLLNAEDSDTLYDPYEDEREDGQGGFHILPSGLRKDRKIAGVTKDTKLLPQLTASLDGEEAAADDQISDQEKPDHQKSNDPISDGLKSNGQKANDQLNEDLDRLFANFRLKNQGRSAQQADDADFADNADAAVGRAAGNRKSTIAGSDHDDAVSNDQTGKSGKASGRRRLPGFGDIFRSSKDIGRASSGGAVFDASSRSNDDLDGEPVQETFEAGEDDFLHILPRGDRTGTGRGMAGSRSTGAGGSAGSIGRNNGLVGSVSSTGRNTGSGGSAAGTGRNTGSGGSVAGAGRNNGSGGSAAGTGRNNGANGLAGRTGIGGEDGLSSKPTVISDEAARLMAENAQEGASGGGARKKHASEEEINAGIKDVEAEIAQNDIPKPEYVFPPTSLLSLPQRGKQGTSESDLRETAATLQKVFQTFNVNVKITDVTCGPSVTRYELMPEMGVKVSKIVSLQDDIKLNLAVTDIRIEAPIPGKAAVGIEVPNKHPSGVLLRELLEAPEFTNHKSNMAYVVGKDIAGNIIVSDIAKMPHLLIAGATGSGKSVFINTLVMSILYKAKPEDVKLIMIDPKVVELSVYNGIPHLFIPVVTDPKKAAGALNWAVAEMMNRYQKFAENHVRDLKGYNARIASLGDDVPEETKPAKMPQIIIIVDELADLMMVASSEVEDAICRLAQLARAAGIHLVIATQRPSVDVITGLIKANMPSRIAFSVSSGVDSRTVLDQVGAEKLLGNGDMLFYPQTFKQPLRVQGAFISDAEVAAIVENIKENNADGADPDALAKRMEAVEKSASTAGAAGGSGDVDELFAEAGRFIIEKDKASIGMLQRWFKIGFNRAARIMDQLSDAGVVGPDEGTKPRKVEMSMEQFEAYLEQN